MARRSGTPHCLLTLIGAQEHGGFQGRVPAGAAERQATGGTAFIVQKVDNGDAVIFTEGKEKGLHPAIEGFNCLAQLRGSILRFFVEKVRHDPHSAALAGVFA
jgi:hypothetical protein